MATVSLTQLGYVSTLIAGLKTDSIWTKLDRLWLYASENATQAQFDLVAKSGHTVVNSPTFTANMGYTGEDLASPTKYINTNYNPFTSAINYTRDSAHLSAWSVGNVASVNGGCLVGGLGGGGVRVEIYDTYLDGNVYTAINDNSASQGAPGTRAGQWLINRSGASASQLYQNGSNFASPNLLSAAVDNFNICALAFNQNGTIVTGTPNQIAMIGIGGSLSSTDASNFYSRLRTYMTAVGVP